MRFTRCSRRALLTLLAAAMASAKRSNRMRFDLVAYLWGRDWGNPTLTADCSELVDTYCGIRQ